MAVFRYIVNDVSAAVGFYVDQLHFELVEQYGPAMAIVTSDGMTLWLAGPPASASRPMPDGSQPVPGGWNRMVLTVDNIDEVTATLREAGVAFRNEIVTGPGGRQILCEDPAGNPIELFQPAES